MRVLVYSDVHGNLPAFKKMLEVTGPCDAHICLGDLVNYGPWSNECVDLALSLNACINLMGNHEAAFIEGKYPGENQLVEQFFNQTIADFSRFDEISRFVDVYVNYGFCFQHTVDNRYIYPDTTMSLDNNYVIGHSHHQFVYHSNGFTMVNAGSVGQNRQFINIINFLILETSTGEITRHEIPYDVDIVIDKMRSLDYPEACIAYYQSKARK